MPVQDQESDLRAISMARWIKAGALVVIGLIVGSVVMYLMLEWHSRAQAETAHYMGIKHYDEGHHEEAVALLNQSIGLDPDKAGPYRLLGRIYAQKGSDDFALTLYKAAQEKPDAKTYQVDYYVTQCAIADLLMKAGKKEDGGALYRQVRQEYPEIEKFLTGFLELSAKKTEKSEVRAQTEILYKRFLHSLAK